MGGPWVNRLKVDLRYRRGGKDADCRRCNSYVERYRVGGAASRHDAGFHSRCRVIGLQYSARYNVKPDCVCDRFDGTIARLLDMGEAWYRENYGEEKLREAIAAREEREAFEKQLKKEGKL